MRYLILIFLSLIIFPSLKAQSFRERTNGIKIDFSKKEKVVLPVIKWVTPIYETSSSQDGKIYLEAQVTSQTALSKVYLKITYPDQTSTEREYALDEGSFSKDITQRLNLSDGQYLLTLVAINSAGGEISDSRTFLIGLDAVTSAVSINRKDKAILFATDKYDYWTDLVNPVYDANTIAQILEEKYGFEIEIVENATQNEVFNKLADYSQKMYDPQDQLMIFFAGHGYFDETFTEGFVVAKNSLENDRAKTSYISHNRLRAIIDNIPCEHIFLVMDVCFGGTFDPKIAGSRNLDKTSIDTNNEFLARKLSYKTRKYLTSGGKTYVSDGIIGQHSPFAREIITSLKAGGGSDKILTISEIRPYVEKLIPEPRLGSFGADDDASDFVFVEKVN